MALRIRSRYCQCIVSEQRCRLEELRVDEQTVLLLCATCATIQAALSCLLCDRESRGRCVLSDCAKRSSVRSE